MPKSKWFTLASLITLLALVAAAAVAIGRPAAVATTSTDPDMMVPSTNMPLSAGWKAHPVAGAPVSLPWANLRVNTDNTNEAQNEPSVAVDPSNAKHMVVGANNWQAGTGQFEVYAYVTFDGGQTWTASQPYINRNASRLNAADPTVAFAADGTVYFAFVAFAPADGAVALSSSRDGGLTWTSQSWASSFTGGAADKPTLAVGNGTVYVLWQGTSLYARSSANGGASWSTIRSIEANGRNANALVDRNGALTVFYNAGSFLRVARDTGSSFTVNTVAKTAALQARPTHYRASNYPTAGMAPDGTLYVAWADGRNVGRGNDIMISHSADGSTWSNATVVNTDASAADQLMPALTVDAAGAVNVAWLDTRNDPNNYNYDVYLARATDGVHFESNVRVTKVSSNPDNDPRTQGTLIGDYFAMAAGNGILYPVWTDTRNNNEDIFMAPVGISTTDR
jgi:BNR repeat protein